MISVLVFIVTVLVGIAIVGFLAELVYLLAGFVGTVIGAVLYPVIRFYRRAIPRFAIPRFAWLAGYACAALLYRSHQLRRVSRVVAYPGTAPAKPSRPPPV